MSLQLPIWVKFWPQGTNRTRLWLFSAVCSLIMMFHQTTTVADCLVVLGTLKRIFSAVCTLMSMKSPNGLEKYPSRVTLMLLHSLRQSLLNTASGVVLASRRASPRASGWRTIILHWCSAERLVSSSMTLAVVFLLRVSSISKAESYCMSASLSRTRYSPTDDQREVNGLWIKTKPTSLQLPPARNGLSFSCFTLSGKLTWTPQHRQSVLNTKYDVITCKKGFQKQTSRRPEEQPA